MIKFLGTNHLDSEEYIIKEIEKYSPDIICLELCDFRIQSLLRELKNKKKYIGIRKNNILNKITESIRNKADKKGLDYGSDQKSALKYCQENNVRCFGVDMPILKIQELFSKIPEVEQAGFEKELTDFEKETISNNVNEQEVLNKLKQNYPISFEFLINMRNLFISNSITKLMRDNRDKRIMVILGKGHIKQVEVMVR